MAVDKNLFVHDLAIVAIMKYEGSYLKEWLDYHLMAGVDHFYLYDHNSPDNQIEVAKPYVEAGLADYFVVPDEDSILLLYNEAVKNFKFLSRYIAFIDLDEFVYPKVDMGGGIVEVVDEILSDAPNAGELGISWQMFGSNGQEKADFSRGVLERFTRRASHSTNPHTWCKFVANPRTINYIDSPHCAIHYEGFVAINEQGKVKPNPPWHIKPPMTDKIVINHYQCKTWEEYQRKIKRGDGIYPTTDRYSRKAFDEYDLNEVFDDGILRYRAERAKTFRLPDRSHDIERLLNALSANLSPTLVSTTPTQFYAGKMETFLTCRALADYLKTRLTDDAPAKFYEEAALKAVLQTAAIGAMTFADARLLLSEMPNLLSLPYPAVDDLRKACIQFIPQLTIPFHRYNQWSEIAELDYIQRLLQSWKPQ